MRISDWSSDVCSSDLASAKRRRARRREACAYLGRDLDIRSCRAKSRHPEGVRKRWASRLRSMRTGKGESVQTHIRERYSPNGRAPQSPSSAKRRQATRRCAGARAPRLPPRSEEHTSELQSLMRNSYTGFSLKKKCEVKNITS